MLEEEGLPDVGSNAEEMDVRERGYAADSHMSLWDWENWINWKKVLGT